MSAPERRSIKSRLPGGCEGHGGAGQGHQDEPAGRGRMVWLMLGLLPVLATAACTAVPPAKQQLVSKPNMIFDDTNEFAFSARLLPQCEPGSSTAGSSPGGGCTACR